MKKDNSSHAIYRFRVKYLASKSGSTERQKNVLAYRTFLSCASDECLMEVSDFPLVSNSFSKCHPIWRLLSSGIYKTCQVSIDRKFLRLAVILSVNLLHPMCSNFQKRQLSFLCILIKLCYDKNRREC